ncbi:protein kinase domain-containing protein [Butyrivibrio sp. YAB3001]|uniref:protein kinase domain-containing protein n=1 Tax=Butyrivibrio sp. YAB3001 TaxID=1520812 RepID=UPI0008F675BA|nr:protein kinase [Butyrivibrio sp. YAB3001]SFB81482.1 Protein kinase domain-containing protein [Butyrivibrio sp. YAB3001]
MDTSWTKKEIEEILWQLDKMQLPFTNSSIFFSNQNKELGEGGSGYVFDCYRRRDGKCEGVIKVIGFKDFADYIGIHRETMLQQEVARQCKNVVKIYEAVCLKLWLNEDGQVTKTQIMQKESAKDEFKYDCNCITLAFIRMEKLQPVIYKDESGKIKCFNNELISKTNEEVMKLFYDTACAVEAAHKRKILHGDIKLENIFYDKVHKIYKLGDFGSAVQTEFGVAKVAGYTNGYVAPEVYNCTVRKFDAAADIYSLGMAIYILRNQLVKIGSSNYSPNLELQYQEDYVLEKPVNDSEDDDYLYMILRKMCSYHPADRPKKMRDIIGMIVGIMVRPWYGMQVKHIWSYVIFGILLIAKGAISGMGEYQPWLTESAVLGFVVCIKAASLCIRNRKIYRCLYLFRKIDMTYLLSILAIEAWNIGGTCILFSDIIHGTDYFYVDAPRCLFWITVIEFTLLLSLDKLKKDAQDLYCEWSRFLFLAKEEWRKL